MATGDPGTATSATPPEKFPQTSRRRFNPLGGFSSYTYQLSLYMVSPDAYNDFAQTGRKTINPPAAPGGQTSGTVIVAQSGGVNNSAIERAAGFNLDYYIDDLKISHVVNPKAAGTATTALELSFTITEPYGFSFITNMKKALDQLKASSTIPNYSKMNDASKQFFVLGIRFQGYDAGGNPVTGANVFAADTINPNADGVFERFYDITITSIKFRIDGRATVYNIKAVSTPPQVAFGVKRGRINNDIKITAEEVWEAIGGSDNKSDGVIGILDILNETQKQLATAKIKTDTGEKAAEIEFANQYSLRWLSDARDKIGRSKIVSPVDKDKSKMPMSPVETSIESNEAASNSPPDKNKRTLTFKNDTSVMQAISSVILQSSYLEKAMQVVMQNSELSTDNNDPDGEFDKGGKNKISWYNLSADVKIIGWDTKINDFAYKIDYAIQQYSTPAAVSSYGNSPTEYYGPHKRYAYWYTGENSEILKYEQTLDNLYYMEVLGGGTPIDGNGDMAQIALAPNAQTNGNNQGRIGAALNPQNSYVANLYDPTAHTKVKIQILGDPDFLMQDAPEPVEEQFDPFYCADGKTIRNTGNQVFIEIDFKEAKDYNNETGLLDINSSILFWKYPPGLADLVHGVSYMVLKITSSFSKGSFTQEIDATVNTFPNWVDPATPAAASSSVASNNQSSPDN